MPFIVAAVILVLLLLLAVNSIRIVPQASAFVIERLGVFKDVWGSGPHFKIPGIDRVARRVSLKERILDYPPQPVITKDNVTMQIDTVVYYMVTDPRLYSYGHDNPLMAIEKLTATTLRNIIGEMELDQTLTSREVINDKMRIVLDEVTDPWGIKINRVELKNILPPQDIQTAMEKQMKAEREKRESILRAEGEKQSLILRAEGEKESTILRAEAQKEQMIRIADGEAASVLKVNEANAKALAMLRESNPNEFVVAIKGLEALEKLADGQATKIIIPTEIQSIAGLASSLSAVLSNPDKK
ncbi:MAG: SPFH/Band 7/PHB domain protein [Eubacteriaceae bacterium]|jgi:regulator of protease activity HflC (stomatin/prohibitin superfamily)|nr:SPFH/Band 7/PHB domain protein [Eubacteriaceae bacterium]